MKGRVVFGFVGVLALLASIVVLRSVARADEPRPQGQESGLAAMGAGFSYQGYLKDSGNPANGSYDLRFALYDAAVEGSQVGVTLNLEDVMVGNGMFSASLDFGPGVFNGQARWLEVSVRPGPATGSFNVLSPRQQLTPAPYAFHAVDAWALGGNGGTSPGFNLLGTTDGASLTLAVSNTAALRLEPNTSPNLVGGHSGNHVAAGKVGAAIGGGGSSTFPNRVAANFGTVGGGAQNTANGEYATVPGGFGGVATHHGEMAYAGGFFAGEGDAQTSVYVLRRTTTSVTETSIFLDGDSATRRLTIGPGRTLAFEALVVARSDVGSSAAYRIRGVVKNQGGTTSMVGATGDVLGEDASSWNAIAAADDANESLDFKVTGASSAPVRWVATVRTVEVAW